jgi:hypothetical protein
MESLIWLAVLLIVFFALVTGFLIFLYLQTSKSLSSATLGQLEAVSALYRDAESRSQEQQKASQKSSSEAVILTLGEIQKAHQQALQAVDLSYTRALSGTNQQTETLSRILKDSLTLLGTKDPIAYQMAQGASSLPREQAGESYTAMDETEEKRSLEDFGRTFMERMVNNASANNAPAGAQGASPFAEFTGEAPWTSD